MFDFQKLEVYQKSRSMHKKHFYIQSRASDFETVACLEACSDLNFLSDSEFKEFNDEYENISKMLFGLIGR